MIAALVELSLKRRILVVILAAGLLVAGILAARDAPIDAFPEFAPPLVEIQTEAPGLSSLEVEQLVTTPIETALAGTSFATTIRSRSVLGLSSVVLLFERSTDVFVARQLVQERLARALPELPSTARAPALMPSVSSTSRILKIGLTSNAMSRIDLTDLAYWTVRPRLMEIPGVANVAVWGAREREYVVRLDPTRLEAMAVTSDAAQLALRSALTPAPGGYIDGPLQRFPIQHSSAANLDEIADLPLISRAGAVVHVRDVASVEEAFPPPIGDALVNGAAGILLIVEKQPWGNTEEITGKIDHALAALAPALQGVVVDASIFRPASFIQRSVSNLETAMLTGCLLVVAVLFAFLWSWRTALISAIAIPLSLAAAILVLRWLGGTLNTMVLAGLVIALGEVVDDAIIDVENILRRLRENRLSVAPRPALRVALDASIEVRSAVVYATAIVVLVFLPVWFLGGVSGAFFRPLALAYVLGVLASLLVALTVTPALGLMLLPHEVDRMRHSPLLMALEERYARLLPMILNWPRTWLGIGSAAILLSVGGFLSLRNAFLPEFRESDFLMHWVAQPGTSLPALQRTASRVGGELRALPGVRSFGAHLGRAEIADEVVGPNFGELWIHFDPEVDHESSVHAVERVIQRYAGLRRDVETYLRERIDEVISGSSGAVVVRVSGTDLETLRRSADHLAATIRGVAGVREVRVEHQALVPELRVEPRREAAVLGFLPGDIRRAVTWLVQGERVGDVIRQGRPVPVVVRGPHGIDTDPSLLGAALITASSGSRARLHDIAQLTFSPTPSVVVHEAGRRRVNVSITVSGDLERVARDIEAAVSRMSFPAGHGAEVLGEWRERSEAQTRLASLSLGALLLIMIVLYFDLGSWRRTALVAGSLPFAAVGGVAAAALAGGVLSLGSLVGLVTVLGIASRNGILLVSHYRQLEHGGTPFGLSLIVRGTIDRLGPILMTATATGLALFPLILGGNRPGHEIEHPMAVVILGGLVSSTLMNLVLMPALYLQFGAANAVPRIEQPSLAVE
jgi:CzcA family heavy metal efflux pump